MDASTSHRSRRRRATLLVLAMVLAIGGIATLGVMDERSIASNVHREIGLEHHMLAEAVAEEVHLGFAGLDRGGPPVALVRVERGVWRFGDGSITVEPRRFIVGDAFTPGGEHRLLLWPTGSGVARTIDGAPVDLPSLVAAAEQGEPRTWLDADEAARLGLPEDLAIAGLAPIDAGRFGAWTLAVVSSIRREAERELRRDARMVVMVGLVSLVIVGFGLALLRTQRQERALEQALARETLRAQQESQLAREGRAATMLTFAAGIAHELSTPLGVIAMRAEQLENSAEDERAQRGARAIGEQVARIREQARRFLALARGAAPLRERFSAASVLRDAAARVMHRFDAAGVALTIAAGDEAVWIHGDARLLEHSLTNLLINACEASREGSTVELTAGMAGRMLTITVSDRGSGVDPVLLTRIQPFFSTKAEHGTGLGLAIASEVAKMHRGELSLHARPGGGTCAMLRLPADAAPDDDHAVTPEAQDPAAAG